MFEFKFPFPPYDIQTRFMNDLFRVLNESKHGIFESPTGTGKSLSIICATLSWLESFEKQRIENLQIKIDQLESEIEKEKRNNEKENKTDDDDEPDWMKNYQESQALKIELNELKISLKKIDEYLECMNKYKIEERLQVQKKDVRELEKDGNPSLIDIDKELQDAQNFRDEQTDDLAPEDYSSDSETNSNKNAYRNPDLGSEEVEDPPYKRQLPQILFCSRTHSQLSQFIKELNKTEFGSNVTAIGMGSRANLCINKSIVNLKHSSAINEACLEMINKDKIKKSDFDNADNIENSMPAKKRRKNATGLKKCEFYNSSKIDSLRKHISTKTSDIEDIVKKGEELSACPYYATRFAAQSMHVLALPYQALLHKSTREALGISLKENVVIIDEAHNLLESLASVQSIELNALDFYQLYRQLNAYMQCYKTRLKSKNLVYLKQLMLVLNQCLRFLGGKVNQDPKQMKSTENSSNLETVNSFTFKAEFDHVNLYKLLVYIEKSQICRKLSGFAISCPTIDEVSNQKIGNNASLKSKSESESGNAIGRFIKEIKENQITQEKAQKKTSQPEKSATDEESLNLHNGSSTQIGSKCKIYQFKSFLEVLISDEKLNCKVLVKKSGQSVADNSVKSFILNPAHMFADVVTQARSVILAGGTMQPFEEFTHQLFSALGVNESKVHLFSCGHIVNKSQIRTLIVEKGPTNEQLQFSYKDRQNEAIFVELGRLLLNVIPRIKGGCVVFFPSYDFENQVSKVLTRDKILDRLIERKPFFKESRASADCDTVFEKYKKQIDLNPQKGAILFAVMGGKMSEGINFSDDYGRCVIVIGMPYPNIKSPELNAKMNFLNQIKNGLGQTHYENLCMKSVNQSIGRAIRHKDDYACVLLVDQRFARENVKNKLPSWMQESIRCCNNFGSVIGDVNNFFKDKWKGNL